MPLYFAYGANLDVPAMAKRCPRSKPIAPAKLMRHRLAIMREGWLTVTCDPNATVHGLLWDLALSDMPALDRYEDLATGLYTKISQPVVTTGGPKRALIYVGANVGPGPGDRDYLASVLAAARALPLPDEGVATLARLAALAGVVDGAPAERPKVRPRFATPFDR